MDVSPATSLHPQFREKHLVFKSTYFGDKVHGGIAEGFQHGRGFRIEEGHSIGHLVIDFVLNV